MKIVLLACIALWAFSTVDAFGYFANVQRTDCEAAVKDLVCLECEAEAGPDGRDGAPGEQGPPGERGLDGPVGRQGPQGIQGPPGESIPGQQGEPGLPGVPGEEGPRGPRGYTGQEGQQGVRGPQGAQGLQGPQGETGEPGVPGPAGLESNDYFNCNMAIGFRYARCNVGYQVTMCKCVGCPTAEKIQGDRCDCNCKSIHQTEARCCGIE